VDTEPTTGQLLAREATARAAHRNLGAGASARKRGKLGETGKAPDGGLNKATRARFAREMVTHRRKKPLLAKREPGRDRRKDQLKMAARKMNSTLAQIWLTKPIFGQKTQTHRYQHKRVKTIQHTQNPKYEFFIAIQSMITIGSRRSPPSLPHLIGTKIGSLLL
jgi:hypothetical protein